MEKRAGVIEVRVTSEGQVQARRKDGKPLSREDIEEAKRLILLDPALPLESFARRKGILRMWSDLLDEVVWFASGEDQVRLLLYRGIHRRAIYTAQELQTLCHFTCSPNVVHKVHDAQLFFFSNQRPMRMVDGSVSVC